jgi:Zn-finger nucleic acid-binding protein
MDLTCPKCHGVMRSYERSGVTVDQCTDCRGIFLDRGELEHLIDADQRFKSEPAAPTYAPPPPSAGYPPQSAGNPPQKKRKKSFFDELFD